MVTSLLCYSLQRTTFDTTDGNAVVVVDATIGGYTTKCGPQTSKEK